VEREAALYDGKSCGSWSAPTARSSAFPQACPQALVGEAGLEAERLASPRLKIAQKLAPEAVPNRSIGFPLVGVLLVMLIFP
jgi:hypothetical protein